MAGKQEERMNDGKYCFVSGNPRQQELYDVLYAVRVPKQCTEVREDQEGSKYHARYNPWS